jgi:hypothetical protein
MADDTRPLGVTGRALPGGTTDNIQAPLRLGRYGETMTQNAGGTTRHVLSNEGSYFFAQNATIDASATLAGHAAPVLADLYTKPFIFMRNADATTSQKRVHLDYIHIQVITAGANGTSDNWAAECDTGATRNSSAGTALTTVNPNMQSSATSVCTLLGGAPVASAATANQRKMGHGVFRPSIAITGDKYTFLFGADATSENNVVASAITHHIVPMPPVILGPTDQFLLHLYAPSQSAAGVYKVSMGWWER